MKHLRERLLTGAIFSLFSLLAITLMQLIAQYFHQDSLQAGNLFTIPYIMGSFFIGFAHYYTLLCKPTALGTRAFHFYAIRKSAFASILAYVIGAACLTVFAIIAFYLHAYRDDATFATTQHLGHIHLIFKIMTATFSKMLDGFMLIGLQHFGLVLMVITSALAGLTLARLRT